jgi:lipoprotein-anchoring transpeptidase ErfK/SrfK
MRRSLTLGGMVMAGAALACVGLYLGQEPVEAGIQAMSATGPAEAMPGIQELAVLQREQRELTARLRALGPRGPYVVVDRGNNRIVLRTRDSVEVEAPASTGSHAVLKETGGQERTWVFETPPGRFSILSERSDPVWTRPDWAFLETGEPIPTRVADRREYGSLGEYALDLGDGYMIHGTLYERLLGRSVTHGCVRVGRDPLRAIVSRTSVGTQVFIF